MTLYEQGCDGASSEPDVEYSRRECVRGVRNTKPPEMKHVRKNDVHFSSEGRMIAQETEGDCSYPALLRMDSSSLFKMNDHESVDIDEVCDQFCGSIDMHECFVENGSDMGHQQSGVHLESEDNFDASTVYTQDKDGDTLLHSVIILQELQLIMLFIQKAASHTWLSFRNNIFQTPLHLAVLTRQVKVVRALMAAGADISVRDKDGNTALHIACRDGLFDIAGNLLEPIRYNEVINNGYKAPYQKIPQDLAVANYEGLSCLHLAAMNDHIEIVELLESKGVDLNIREIKTGRTILHNACLSGNIKLVRQLLKYRSCNINARTYDGLTPFDLARIKNDESICMILAAAGARYGDDEDDFD